MAWLAAPLLALAYGPQFGAAAGLTAFVAAQYALYSTAFGFGVAIKAADRMRLLWVVRAVTAVVSITAVSVLVSWGGLLGAGSAAVVTGATYAAGVLAGYRRMGRDGAAVAES
jgi:O-antigen/teichoic acid export membrane protein